MAVRVQGKVNRIYPTSDGNVNIRLANIPAEDTPQDGYFTLTNGHPNFNALYSLALVAAVNRYDLDIRAKGDDIIAGQPASISYMVIDF
jgi:hypothetical protein